MQVITDLSGTARHRLIAFCGTHLIDDHDAEQYADVLIAETDFGTGNGAHFEISGSDTRTRNPITIDFREAADLVFSALDEDGAVIG